MKDWQRTSLLLCSFGFFREMRPSEPFVMEFLTGEWRNITLEQVNRDIYPFGTYSNLAQLIIIFLVTDILRYKPIIALSACAGIVLMCFLLWTKTVWELQIGQIFYGTFTASEVAYYTYIYAKVEKNKYQIVTGHTRSAILCGKFLGGILAQILISTKAMNYRQLHFISLGSQIISLIFALSLPSVSRSLYFYRMEVKSIELTNSPKEMPKLNVKRQMESKKKESKIITETGIPMGNEIIAETKIEEEYAKPKFSWRHAFHLLWKHIVSSYTNPVVVQWSIWWSLATCGQLQVISYIQFLWKEIDPKNEKFYNGAVEATVTLLGAIGAFAAGLCNSEHYQRWHMSILSGCTLIMGTFILVAATTQFIEITYVTYILFGVAFFFVITIASSKVAENIPEDSFGLIFGINTLAALLLQTIFTIVFITDYGFALNVRGQYVAFGVYFVCLAFLYAVADVIRSCHSSSSITKYSPSDSRVTEDLRF